MAKRRQKSRIDLLVDKLRTADLRLRLASDLGTQQTEMARIELQESKQELEEIIVAVRTGEYNGGDV